MGRNNIVGAWGESLAAEYLTQKKYKIVALNYRSRFGEIDIMDLKRYMADNGISVRLDV
jgi:Holliday junction resolvase-like predicted endonuclease